MIKIMFICHGNICRSPMAEFVFKAMVERAGAVDRFEIASAATSTEEIIRGRGNPVYPPAAAELKRRGIGATAFTDFSRKRARLLTAEDIGHYDLLLCADKSNIRDSRRIVGSDTDGKLRLLLDYSKDPALRGRAISDPWYTGDFSKAFEDVYSGCEGLLESLIKENKQ